MHNNKPRILYIATFPPPIHGSAVVSEQIKNSNIVNSSFIGDYVNLGTSRKMDEIGKSGLLLNLKKLCRFACSFFKTFWLLLIHNYDLCYCAITCHGAGFIKDAPFVLLCKFFRRKIVIHQHNKGMSRCVEKQPYKWLLPLVYNNTKVILLSWYLYPDIEKIVNKEQVLICPNGIPEIFNEEPHFVRLNKVPHLLFLSNLIPSKGVYVLLEACKILKDKGYIFVCDFVGGESKEITRNVFEKLCDERELNERVFYHGPKYGSEKNEFFKNTDIFVFPTYYKNETFGLVNLEAMQYKLPIVTTNEGGIPDVVKDGQNGFVCRRKDANSLADAIEKLITNQELCCKMGQRGYLRYKEEFTLTAFERKFVEVIKKCLCR